MSYHGGIQTRLAAEVSSVSSRVWIDHLRQNATLPAISFNNVDAPQLVEVGPTADAELIKPRLEVWCWAETHGEAVTVAGEVKTALHKWSGTSDSTVFDAVVFDSDRDHYDPELGLWAVVQDFNVIYHE